MTDPRPGRGHDAGLPAGWALIPEPSLLAPSAIRLSPTAQAVAFAYTPAAMFSPVLAVAPGLQAEFEAGHRAYRQAVQHHIAEFVRTVRGCGGDPLVYVVALELAPFLAWCARTGHDPDQPGPRGVYAAVRAAAAPAPDVIVWPPRRGDPCWCSSAHAYGQCCAHPAVAASVGLN